MGWQFRRVSATLGVVAAAVLVPAAVIGGCASNDDVYTCDHYFSNTPCPPDAGADAGHCGDGGPDAGRCDAQPGDGGDASAAGGADGGMAAICNGQCVPKEPVGWFPRRCSGWVRPIRRRRARPLPRRWATRDTPI